MVKTVHFSAVAARRYDQLASENGGDSAEGAREAVLRLLRDSEIICRVAAT